MNVTDLTRTYREDHYSYKEMVSGVKDAFSHVRKGNQSREIER